MGSVALGSCPLLTACSSRFRSAATTNHILLVWQRSSPLLMGEGSFCSPILRTRVLEAPAVLARMAWTADFRNALVFLEFS